MNKIIVGIIVGISLLSTTAFSQATFEDPWQASRSIHHTCGSSVDGSPGAETVREAIQACATTLATYWKRNPEMSFEKFRSSFIGYCSGTIACNGRKQICAIEMSYGYMATNGYMGDNANETIRYCVLAGEKPESCRAKVQCGKFMKHPGDAGFLNNGN